MAVDFPKMTTAEIRSAFLKFFEERGLKLYPSSSLAPDDPSLLLANEPVQGVLPGQEDHEGDRCLLLSEVRAHQ